MKKVSIVVGLIFLMCAVITGCSSKSSAPSDAERVKQFNLTDQFKIDSISVTVTQLVTPDIQYHTDDEIQNMVTAGIKNNLEQANMVTSDNDANSLDIKIKYQKRFMGDETPFPSDALAYPNFSYDIDIKKRDNVLTTISRSNLTCQGSLEMNFKMMANQLKEKSYETQFIGVVVRAISKNIKDLKIKR